MALSSDVEYLNSRDATIMGSRNGHAPIYLWYTLTRKVRPSLAEPRGRQAAPQAHPRPASPASCILKSTPQPGGVPPCLLHRLADCTAGDALPCRVTRACAATWSAACATRTC
jgi:hypothetical protein